MEADATGRITDCRIRIEPPPSSRVCQAIAYKARVLTLAFRPIVDLPSSSVATSGQLNTRKRNRDGSGAGASSEKLTPTMVDLRQSYYAPHGKHFLVQDVIDAVVDFQMRLRSMMRLKTMSDRRLVGFMRYADDVYVMRWDKAPELENVTSETLKELKVKRPLWHCVGPCSHSPLTELARPCPSQLTVTPPTAQSAR